MARNQAVLSSNYDTLINKIHVLESDISIRLREQLSLINTEFDASCAVLAIAEFVSSAEASLTSLLSDAAQQVGGSGRIKAILYQPIVSSAADFQLISGYLNNATAGVGKTAKTDKAIDLFTNTSNSDRVELVRLFRISLPKPLKTTTDTDSNQMRVFSLLSFENIEKILKFGWKNVSESLLFSNSNGEWLICNKL